jgi:Transglutaminase-like superfamily
MTALFFKSWLFLFYLDFVMRFRGFEQLSGLVRDQMTLRASPKHEPSIVEICHSIDLACVFYFKQVLCLQRSAATTVLMRRYGVDARMVIGAQIVPFQSHAWVEVNGAIVNDKPYLLNIYQVLDRY